MATPDGVPSRGHIVQPGSARVSVSYVSHLQTFSIFAYPFRTFGSLALPYLCSFASIRGSNTNNPNNRVLRITLAPMLDLG
jgi:hypothetical protein